MMNGYCEKCKRNKEMINVELKKMINSSFFYIGECVKCGTKIYKRKK